MITYIFPDELSLPEAVFETANCQQLDGSSLEDDDGVSFGLSAGGRMVAYQIADPTEIINHGIKVPYTKILEFRAFRDTVLGREFRMQDDVHGIGYLTVRFFEYQRTWTPEDEWDDFGQQMWSTVIKLRRIIFE